MQTTSQQTALITGAASGFGKEFARIFAREGYNLVLVDVQSEALLNVEGAVKSEFPGTDTFVIHKDLSADHAASEVYEETKKAGKQINVLVNNAGFGEQGVFTDSDWNKENALIHTNIIALVHLTKLYLKEMVSRNDGKILQLASVAAFMPCPNLSVYGASKAFVLSFSEALQYELRESEVKLTILCPGGSDTNFFKAAGADNTAAAQDAPLTDPREVAEAGYKALMKGKKREIVGTMNELQVTMSNFMPDSWSAAMASKLFEEKEPA
jgi:uncharacterized protein